MKSSKKSILIFLFSISFLFLTACASFTPITSLNCVQESVAASLSLTEQAKKGDVRIIIGYTELGTYHAQAQYYENNKWESVIVRDNQVLPSVQTIPDHKITRIIEDDSLKVIYLLSRPVEEKDLN